MALAIIEDVFEKTVFLSLSLNPLSMSKCKKFIKKNISTLVDLRPLNLINQHSFVREYLFLDSHVFLSVLFDCVKESKWLSKWLFIEKCDLRF